MTPTYCILLFLYILNLSLLNSAVKAEEPSEIRLFSCCKFQSILNFESGLCGGTPVYEFDSDTFQSEWNIPKLLTESYPGSVKTIGSLRARYYNLII